MKRYRRTAISQYLVLVFILAVFVGFGVLGTFVMSRVPFADHFAIPWAAGRLWLLEGVSPYDPSVIGLAASVVEESTFLAQLPAEQVFKLPILSLIFYLPFSLVPYSISRVVWIMVLGLSTGFIGFISLRLSGIKLSLPGQIGVILMVIFWFPGVSAILGGYLSPITIALVLAGIYLVIFEQDTTAGLILALTFSAFPTSGLVLILLFVWSISNRRWSILSGFFSGLAFLIIISFLVIPSWFMDWASVMISYLEGWGWIQTPLMDMANLLPGVADFLTILLHVIFGTFALFIIITSFRKSNLIFIYKLSLYFILVYFLHIQGSMMYLLFLVPAMLLVFRFWAERWGVLGNLLSWGLLIVFGAGTWLLVYPTINFTLPIDEKIISLVFPLMVLIGVIWIRWWALNIPRLPYETR